MTEGSTTVSVDKTNGVNIQNTDLAITGGNMTLTNGNMTLTNGNMTINNGDIDVNDNNGNTSLVLIPLATQQPLHF